MPNFTGSLRTNEIFSAIYNMIISQEVFANNIAGTFSELVDKARVDGSLYGDQKLYYATDALKSFAWGADSEATNLLALHRPPAPSCQAIVLDVFRQIPVTVDEYLSKRAWATEGAFASFNGVMLGWMGETKKIYDSTKYNTFIGTAASGATKNKVAVDLQTTSGHPLYNLAGVEKEKMEAMLIAQAMADLFIELKDITRLFNDYHYLRSYNIGELRVVWNAKWVNKIRKVDLPTIFHKDGLIDKFEEHVLPGRYFGFELTTSNYSTYSASTPTTTKPIDSDTGAYTPVSGNQFVLRALDEQDIIVGGTTYHVFPGDELPSGAVVYASSQVKIPSYFEDPNRICVVMHARAVPYMSSFEVGTNFFNGKSLTTNHYLTFGRNTIEILKNYPFIQVNATV